LESQPSLDSPIFLFIIPESPHAVLVFEQVVYESSSRKYPTALRAGSHVRRLLLLGLLLGLRQLLLFLLLLLNYAHTSVSRPN
jgi:hypothetical protein